MENLTHDSIDTLTGASLGVVLGSGLGDVTEAFPASATLAFEDALNIGSSTIAGHRGEFTLCNIEKHACLFVRGRKHYYEGDTKPVHGVIDCLKRAGVETLLLTSAAGSASPLHQPGDLVLADACLDLQFRRPPAGWAPGRARSPRSQVLEGAKRPTTSRAELRSSPVIDSDGRMSLDPGLAATIRRCAAETGVRLGRGVVGVNAGPTYETASEVVLLQRVGVNVVSMSGAPELEYATRLGMRVAIMALVTNWGTGLSQEPLRHQDVLEMGQNAVQSFRALVSELVTKVA